MAKDVRKEELDKIEESIRARADVIADAVEEIAAMSRGFAASKLQRKTIILLISAHSRVSQKNVEVVLNNLELIGKIYLK